MPQDGPQTVRDVSRWWHVLRYYRKRQLAARLFRVGRRALGRWTGVGSPRVAPRGTLALRENPGFHRLAEQRIRGRIGAARETVTVGCPTSTMPDGETRTVLAVGPTAAADRACHIVDGRFEFLNEERRLGNPVDWRLAAYPEAARLWRFHLHYHEFLLDLAARAVQSGERRWSDRAWDLVAQWIEACRPDDSWAMEDAWHPYCISRRLPVWIVLWFAAPPEEELGQRVLQSVFSQADYLARNLEWDLGGNHLLENARALTLAGAFLAGLDADRWLRKGGRLIRAQIDQQVLPHGEHFERSPMYHARMLEAVLDVRDAAERVAPDLSEFCAGAAEKMGRFLESILHPDDEIPLLGDSLFGEAPPARILIERVRPAEKVCDVTGSPHPRPLSRERERGEFPNSNPGPRSPLPAPRAPLPAPCSLLSALRSPLSAPCSPLSAPRSLLSAPRSPLPAPYWVFRDGGDFLLFDAGPVGPDHLPAHAHADLLGIEASWNGRRLFVDSGVFNYEDDAMRRYCRSTAAHNCLEVDGQDQCDMWSRFRMGHRGWPGPLETGCDDGFFWAWATHDAYRRLGVPRVGRFLACRSGGPWFCVDWAEGKRTHRLTHRLHLDPSVQTAFLSDVAIELRAGGASLRLEFLTPGRLSVDLACHCPEFGVRIQAPVIRWDIESPLPAAVAWSLAPASEPSPTTPSLGDVLALASRAGVPLASRQCHPACGPANPAQPAISAWLARHSGLKVDASGRPSHSEEVPRRSSAKPSSGNLP